MDADEGRGAQQRNSWYEKKFGKAMNNATLRHESPNENESGCNWVTNKLKAQLARYEKITFILISLHFRPDLDTSILICCR